MADEATATLTPPIEVIHYGIDELTSNEVIRKIKEFVSYNQEIELDLVFPAHYDDPAHYELFKFDATVTMQNTVFENIRHIKTLRMCNDCNIREEHKRCFAFCIKIVLGIIGKGKHLIYETFDFELEQANELAQALLRLNNNNNGAIDSFELNEMELTPVTLQPVLDALLDSGVRKIEFGNDYTMSPPIDYNNNNINFTGIKKNISLKELDLGRFDMQEEDCRNLFTSLKVNKGLEKLQLRYTTYSYLSTRMKRLFKQILRENITLLDFRLVDCEGDDVEIDDPIFKVIQFHTTVNPMMKRYIVKRNTESTVAAMAVHAGAGAGAGIGGRDCARARASTKEANNNNKKWLKMRMLLNLFIQKPVFRDTMIFHLLRDYPDDLMDTDFHCRIDVHDRDDDDRGTNDQDDARDMERDDDRDSESNNCTDDPDDSEVDSETADGTDGIF